MAAGITVVIVLIMVLAMVDWYVMTIVNPAYSYSTPQTMAIFNSHYWFWLTVLILAFGFCCAALMKVTYSYSPVGDYLAGMVVVADILLYVGNFEDDMYFLLGQHSFPSNTTQWTWMEQYKLFGFWTTSNQIVWSIFWLLIVLPAAIYVFTRAIRKYKRTRILVRFS